MKNFTKTILTVFILIAVFIWVNLAKSPESKDQVRIYFFDVGQGDSALIQKGNYQILIDGGPDDKVLPELGKAMPLSDRKIELIVLTHPHADHLVGLNQILERYEVEKIYSTGVIHTSNAYLEFLNKVKVNKINYSVPDVGEQIIPYEHANFSFLWPGKKFQEKSIDNLNDSSIVSKFCYFEHCALFMGDLETTGQEEMFSEYSNYEVFPSELMKISHHGSSNGTNQRLLETVKPKFAIISVGKDNKFGHPNDSVINLLSNIQCLRTDFKGTILFVLSEVGISEAK